MGVKEEKARQSCWCWTKTGRQLAPVKPTRCHKMFDECSAFDKRLTSCERQIKELKKATDGLLIISEKVLSRPLPQVWDNNPAGEAHPVPGTGTPLIAPGQLKRSNSADLQQEVINPITAWQAEYARLKLRMAELDKQSLRVDAARRAHYKNTQKSLKENVMQRDNVSAPTPQEAEDGVLTGARATYAKLEGEVHEELRRLADNARHVQDYLTRAMALQANTLSAAASTHSQGSARGLASGAGTPVAGASPLGQQQAFPAAPTHQPTAPTAPAATQLTA